MTKLKIHKVISGPMEDEGGEHFGIVALTEQNGMMITDEVWSDSEEDIQEIINHLKVSIQPFEIEAQWTETSYRN
jgi:hypothetical protein